MPAATSQTILFDWGNTVMRDFPAYSGPMHAWPEVEAMPGIRAALQKLQPHCTLALATNAADSDAADIRKALERCGVSTFFDRIFCFREVGHRKPETAFYQAVLADLEAEPTEVFMVGDSFEGDVVAANVVGIAAVWFNSESDEVSTGPNHRTIHLFEELIPALRELGARVNGSTSR